MTIRTITVGAAIALALGSASARAADFGDIFSFNGFGTLGMVHSSEDQADYIGTVFQPDGAGFTEDWDLRPGTLLGGQINMQFNEKFSAVIQAVSQHQHDKKWTPYIEWANLKYQVTDNLSIRAGRVVLPAFLISESRFVGFANPWVRPPQELYFLSSITNSDGGDLTYNFNTGSLKHTFTGFYGKSNPKLPTGEIDANKIYGGNYSIEFGSTKLRAGYVFENIDNTIGAVTPLFNGLQGLNAGLAGAGFADAAAQGRAMFERNKLEDNNLHIYTLGGTYDPGTAFLTTEVASFRSESILQDAKAGYITGGFRFKNFTPYATVATLQSDKKTDPGISTAGLPAQLAGAVAQINGAFNQILRQTVASQNSASVGLRWDFMSGADLKVQYDRISLEDNSKGRLTINQPGFVPGDVDLISISVDFIF